MQKAIDYMNDTFHEKNESMKSVANILSSMTDSLHNFNVNLNAINDTLSGVKGFLKHLNNSVFNIDDVIKYIDYSIFNLDDTVYSLNASVSDMTGTLSGITGRVEDVNSSLKMINKTVIDVRDTSVSTNRTLNSMNTTLQRLEDILSTFGVKLNQMIDGIDGINISLRNINNSVQNSYSRLGKLGRKVEDMNGTIRSINTTIGRLSSTYQRIDNVLRDMNESFSFLNGTVLEVLTNLSGVNATIADVSTNVDLIEKGKENMNKSLADILLWMKSMLNVIKSLNGTLEKSNDTITIGLEDKDLLDGLNTLLTMNGSIRSTSRDVDQVNDKLLEMETKILTLESSLNQIEDSLANMNTTLLTFTKLLGNVNVTIHMIDGQLDTINGTLKAVAKATNEIDISISNDKGTLKSANDSLSLVDKFISSASGSVDTINDTISNVQMNSNLIVESVDMFISELHQLPGSLPELNNTILNNREYLEIISEEASILEQSMGIASDNIYNLQTAHVDMTLILDEISDVLKNSRHSQNNIKQSIASVNETLIDILESLNDIDISSMELNQSFSNVSSAFPKIKMQITSVLTRSNRLQRLAKLLSQKLQNNNMNYTTTSHSLKSQDNIYNQLKERMTNLEETLSNLLLEREKTNKQIKYMLDVVRNANTTLEEISKKVSLMNSQLDNLRSKYKLLENVSKETNTSILDSNESVEELEESLNYFEDTLLDYPKLNVSLETYRDDLMEAKQVLSDTNSSFYESTKMFKLQNNTIWNIDGSPKIQNRTFINLKEAVNSLNLSMDAHNKSLLDTQLDLDSINSLSTTLGGKFRKINETIKLLNALENNTLDIEETLDLLSKNFDKAERHINQTTYALTNLLNHLDLIEQQYGDINGSYNATDSYIEQRSTILELLNKLHLDQKDFEDKRKVFSIVMKDFNNTALLFKSTDFGIDTKSDILLKQLLVKMDDTVLATKNLDDSLKDINASIASLNVEKLNSKNNIISLENTLIAEMHKNNFVTKEGNRLEEDYENIHISINNILDVVRKRYKTISQLNTHKHSLNEEVKNMGSMNITFTNETSILNAANVTLDKITNLLENISITLTDNQNHFEDFDETNLTLKAVKTKYQDFFAFTQKHKYDLYIYKQSVDDMKTPLYDVNTTLNYMDILLNLYDSVGNYVVETDGKLQNVSYSHLNVRSRLKELFQKIADVNSFFHSIEQTYTNLSSGSLKESATYIHDLLTEKQQTLRNANESINNISKMFDNSSMLFKILNNTFWNSTYTRMNIPHIILPINSTLAEINEDMDLMVILLDNLNKLFLSTNLSLYEMDNILHERNGHLFVKRQKQLYVSEKLPDLTNLYTFVNKSLHNLRHERHRVSENLTLLRDDKMFLGIKQDTLQNINISLNQTDSEIQNIDNFLSQLSNDILNLQMQYEQINESFVSENVSDILKYFTFEETKQLFETSENILNNISFALGQLNTDTKYMKLRLNTQITFLQQLNNSFEIFKELKNVSDENEIQWQTINETISSNDIAIYSINESLSKAERLLSFLASTFQELAPNTLTSALSKPIDTLNKLHSRFSDTINYRANVSVLEFETDNLLTLTEQKLNDAITTFDYLKEITNNIKYQQADQEVNFKKLSANHTFINTRLQILRKDLNDFNEQVNQANIYLQMEEKLQYMKNNLPKLLQFQQEVNQRIQNSSNTLSTLSNLLEIVDALFNSTQNLVQEQSKLNISLTDIGTFDPHMKAIMSNASYLLSNASTWSNNIENNLTEKYFKEVLENDTLHDFVTRFALVNKSHDLLSHQLETIENNLQNGFKILDLDKSYLDDIQHELSVIDLTNDYVDGILSNLNNYSSRLNTTLELQSASNLGSIGNTIDILNKSFAHLNNTELRQELLSYIEQMNSLLNEEKILVHLLFELDEMNINSQSAANRLTDLNLLPVTSLAQLKDNIQDQISLALKIENTTVDGDKTLQNISEHIFNLSQNISNLQTAIDNLEQKFIMQDKETYLQLITPSLEQKYADITKFLQDTNFTVQKYSHLLHNAKGNLLELDERLQEMESVNISTLGFQNQYIVASKAILDSLMALDNATEALHFLNFYRIKNNTTYMGEHVNKTELIKEIDTLNRSLDDILILAKGINQGILETKAEIQINDESVLDVLDDLDYISDLINGTLLESEELMKMQGMFNDTNQSIFNLSMTLEKLNLTLTNVSLNLAGKNYSKLANETQLLQNHLQQELINVSELSNLSNKSKYIIADAFQKLNELQDVLETVSKDDISLKAKIANGSNIFDKIDDLKHSLEKHLAQILNNIPSRNLAAKTIQTELQDLQDDIEDKQIKDFINQNLPKLYTKYNLIDKTIHGLDKSYQSIQSDIKKLQQRALTLDDNLKSFPTLNISVKNILSKSNNMSDELEFLQYALKMKNDTLRTLNLALSENFSSNQTIVDVKDRFINNSIFLNQILDELHLITMPLENITQFIVNNNEKLDNFTEILTSFMSMQNVLQSIHAQLQNYSLKYSDLNKIARDNSDQINTLSDNIVEVKSRIVDIDDKKLHKEFSNLKDKVVYENRTVIDLKRNTESEIEILDSQVERVKEDMEILKGPMSSFDALDENLNLVSNSTTNLKHYLENTDHTYASTKLKLGNQTNRLSELEEHKKDLVESLVHKEKENYVKTILPVLNKLHSYIKESLNDTFNALSMLAYNITNVQNIFEDINDLINSTHHLNMSTKAMASDIVSLEQELNDSEELFGKQELIFNSINIYALQNLNISALTLEDLQQNISAINNTLNELYHSLSTISRTTNEAAHRIVSTENRLNNSLHSIETYIEQAADISVIGEDVFQVVKKIENTNNIIDEVNQTLYTQIETLNRLLSDNNSIDIALEREIELFKNISGKVKLSLPQIRKLVEGTITAGNAEINSLFLKVSNLLNNTIITFDALENTTEYTFQLFDNISDANNLLHQETKYALEDGMKMLNLLRQSNDTLERIKESLRLKNKRIYIEETYPEYFKRYVNLNTSIGKAFVELNSSSQVLLLLSTLLKDTNDDINNQSSLNISTNLLKENVLELNKELERIFNDIHIINDTYLKYNITDLNDKELILSDQIKLQDIQEMYSVFNDSLAELQEKLNSAIKHNIRLAKEADNSKTNINQLKSLVQSFSETEGNLNYVSKEIQMAYKNKTEVHTLVTDIENKTQALNHSLQQMLHNFRDFSHHYSQNNSEKTSIANLTDKIEDLSQWLEKATQQLISTDDEHTSTQSEFYQIYDDEQTIGNMLISVKRNIEDSKENITLVQKILNEILSELPNYELSLKTIAKAIEDKENMFHNQQKKALLMKEIKPSIDQNILNINKAFKSTNSSLERAAAELSILEAEKNKLQHYLMSFATVNISLSDISANITFVDDKLNYLRSEYNDMQNLVVQLRQDIDDYKFLNESLTPEDVAIQYREFNNTLKTVASELQEISDESDSLSHEFSNMNNKVSFIEEHLDKFQLQKTEINQLTEKLMDVNETLNTGFTTINDFRNQAQKINKSLGLLAKTYSAVINTTEENKTKVEEELEKLTAYLNLATLKFAVLSKNLTDSDVIHKSMNRRIGTMINSTEDLNATVAHLQITNKTLHNQLESIQDEILKWNNETIMFSNSLKTLPEIVHEMNRMLVEEQKKKYVEDSFPLHRDVYQKLNFSLENVFEVLYLSREAIGKFENTLNLTTSKIKEIANVNISTEPYSKMFKHFNHSLDQLFFKANETLQKYTAFNISVLFGKNIIENKTITLNVLKDNYERSNKLLHSINKTLTSLKDSNNILISEINNTHKTLNDVLQILMYFDEVNHSLTVVSGLINAANKNKSETAAKLSKVLSEVEILQTSLKKIKSNFSDFNYNSSKEEQLLNTISLLVFELQDRFNEATKQFSHAEMGHTSAENSLKKTVDAPDILSDTLSNVSKQLGINREIIYNFILSLRQINDDLPNIDLNTSVANTAISKMKAVLINQQSKSYYVQEKKPIFKTMIQNLDERFQRLNASFKQAENKIFKLNFTANILNERINSFPTVDIGMTEITQNISESANVLGLNKDLYANMQKDLNELKTNLDIYNHLKETLIIDDVDHQYSEFNNTLENIVSTVKRIEEDIMSLGPLFTETDTSMANINRDLDEFERQTGTFGKLEGNVRDIQESLTNSKEGVNNLDTVASQLRQYLDSLKKNYSDVINTTHDSQDLVNIKLQNVTEYIERAIAYLNSTEGSINTSLLAIMVANQTLNNNIQKASKLNEMVNQAKNSSSEILKHLETIQKSIWDQNNNTVSFTDSLKQIPSILENIAQILAKKQKQRYIERSFPKYQGQYEYLNISLSDVLNELSYSNKSIRTLGKKLQALKTKVSNISSVQIPLFAFEKAAHEFEETLVVLYLSANESLSNYSMLNALTLNGTSLIENQQLTLKILKENYNSANKTLTQVKTNLNTVSRNNVVLVSSINASHDTLDSLQDLLKFFDSVKTNFKSRSKQIELAKTTKDKTEVRLNGVMDDIRKLNTSLLQLKQDYSRFQYNSTSEERQIEQLVHIMFNLNNRFKEAKSLLTSIETMHRKSNNSLFKTEDNPDKLNKTLVSVQTQLLAAKTNIQTFEETVKLILNDIPAIDLNITAAAQAINHMETVLVNQHDKDEYVKEAKPVLQFRLENTTSAFKNINLSLEIMHKEIKDLEKYVDFVKGRLDGLPTVNISLSDIDTNMTELENRLIIMQDYYNNVQEILTHLQGNIDHYNVFKDNLTVNNVQNQYSMFNKTLDNVDAVLGKIGVEYNSFGTQFTNINNTLNDIDLAVDRFEEKTVKVKILEDDIHSLGASLTETSKHLNDMISVAHRLNESFLLLKENYSDVINKTTEKNSDVEQKIHNIEQYLKEAKHIVDYVTNLYVASQSNFTKINQSLFKDIYTYEDLNSTLSDVKMLHKTIRVQIKGMQNLLSHKNNETNKFNLTLNDMTGILEELKLVLDEEQKDQEKLNFINTHMDEIETQFTALQDPIKQTKISIITQGKNVADIQKLGKKVGHRLGKFRTLNITTDEEQKRTEQLKNKISKLNSNLTDTNKTINEVKQLIDSLRDRSISLDDIKSKFNSVNDTINDLNAALVNVNHQLSVNKNETTSTKKDLLKLQSTMDALKSIQMKLRKIRSTFKGLDSSSSDTLLDLTKIQNFLSNLNISVKAMDMMQTLLDDPDYKVFRSKAKVDLANFKADHQNINTSSSQIGVKLQNAETLLENLTKSVKKMLTRDVVFEAIPKLQQHLIKTSTYIDQLQSPVQQTRKESNHLLGKLTGFNVDAENMNKMLFTELEKYQYVKDKLPLLQTKHSSINETLVESIPKIESINDKLAHMKEVIAKIKEKMKIFGVEDSDGSIAQWDKKIKELDVSIQKVVKRHKTNEQTLHDLKNDLWKDTKSMFTKDDTLNALQTKFENYNKIITDMDTSVGDIVGNLTILDVSTITVLQDLVDRNTILTTTPPTTTPSGAPECKSLSLSLSLSLSKCNKSTNIRNIGRTHQF